MKNSIFTVISCHYSDVSKRLRFETGGKRMKRKHQQRYVKKSKSFIVLFFLILCIFGRFNIVNATCSSGIKGNGTNGISININAAPYTTFAGYSYGQYAYGKEGCAWFASARVKELTGQGNTIFSGWAWYNTQYGNYGFSRGSVPKAKSLACYGKHVAVVEAVNGDTVTVSQGGMSGLSDAAHGYCVISTMSRSKLESQGGCGTFYGYVYMNASEPNSKDPLSISNVRVSDVNSNSYKVSCNIAGNVTKVLFPTWPSADDSGNPIWHDGTINGDTASCVIKKSDHGNKTGLYLTHIYAYDMNGNMTAGRAPGVIIGDTEPPVIENIKIIDVTEESYTITCTVKDNNSSGTISVRFPTWPSADDSGNPIWHEGRVNGDTASCVIKKSDHGNKTGTYISHIYAYDVVGNSSSAAAPAVELGKKHQHVYTSSIKKPATCTEPGIRLYTCKDNDDSYEEEIPATGHQHTELRNVKAATCAQEGYTGDTYCKDCNTKLGAGKSIAKKEHTWDSGKITTAATCNGKGIKTYTCTGCNATRTEEIPSTGHQHTELRNVKVATCVSEGYTGDTYCKDCNTKLTSGKVIPKTDHTWDSGKVTQNATCTAKGIKTFTCTVCNSTRIEDIPVIEHVNKITKFAKEASCKSEGYTGDVYCRDCGILIEEGKVIPKADHVWNKGEITTPATCTTKGIKTYSCASCGTTKTEAIAATGHGATEIRNKKDATTTSEGYTGDIYCTICNQKISSGKKIAKLTPQTATPGKTIKDKSTNGVYKVLQDGVSVEFTKPVYKKASVRIPDTIKVNGITCKVTGISANAFKNNKSLKSVTIGRNVTVIGTNAFYGCKKLSKVSGGNGIVKIGHRAFANCISLSKITIPGSVRSIGKQAFCNCKKLSSITIKTSTLSGKTVGSKAFAGTYKKPTVKVPAKQMKAYKKLLKARGMSSKAVYRK